MLRYAIILNPMAGRGRAGKIADNISRLISEQIGGSTLFTTEYQGHATEIAKQIKNDYDVIIGAGGDGTMHELVNGMIFGKAALAAIPIGSGNDFVKMLNLPKNPEEAVNVIKNNQRMKIDIGQIGNQYFPNGVGIGFDAWVVRESLKVKRLRGFLIYLYSVLKTVFSYKNEKIEFFANGKNEEKEIFLIAVGNGRAMGGGFYLTPSAEIDDGQFDICIIHGLSKREVFLNLPKAIKGAHTDMEQVQMLRTNKLKILSQKGIAVHADGELLGLNFKELNIKILPKVFEVIHNIN